MVKYPLVYYSRVLHFFFLLLTKVGVQCLKDKLIIKKRKLLRRILAPHNLQLSMWLR